MLSPGERVARIVAARRRRWRRVGCTALGCFGLAVVACGGLLTAIGAPVAVRGLAAIRERQPRTAGAPGEWIRSGDVELHVLRRGPPEGRPVVLICGPVAWGGTWGPVAEGLAGAGFLVVAPDLPPFGFSERPADGRYDTAAQAGRILALVDALDLQGITFVGHSSGGPVAVQAAILAGGRAERLVLIDPVLNLAAEPPPAGAALLATEPVREVLVSATLTNPALIPLGLRQRVADPASVTAEWVAAYRAPLGVRGTTTAVGQWLAVQLEPVPSLASEPAIYRALPLPTLIVWGERDGVVPLSQGEHLRELIADARLEVLDGVGHLPQVEDAGALTDAMLSFLARE